MISKKILCLQTQIIGHGGIPRFNQNLHEVFRRVAKLKILSLNDVNVDGAVGFGRNKTGMVLAYIKNLLSWPDILILGHLHLAPLALISYVFRIKTVLILHGVEAWSPKGINLWALKLIDEFWPVSAYTCHEFQKSTGIEASRMKLIFNTLPPTWYAPTKERESLPYFLTVTRLDVEDSYKGIDTTIEALDGLKDELRADGWNYKIVASGTDLQRHKDLVESLQLDDIVIFFSSVTDAELSDLYGECSFFIMPSTGEGFGIVFLEAMASKKACIGAKCSGAEDVILDGSTGFLITQEKEEIKAKIEVLTTDKDLCRSMGSDGYERLLENFTFERFEARIKELLV